MYNSSEDLYRNIDQPRAIGSFDKIKKQTGWCPSIAFERSLLDTYNINDLITNVMLYLVTNSFNTSTWIYYGRREEGGRIMNSDGKRVEVPTACALFPRELLSWPPRSYVDRLYNVVQWNEFSKGGHFAAMEEPELLIKDIIDYFNLLKK